MRNLILFALLIILLLSAQFASAKTVDEIIEKYIRARGGKNKLDSIKSICMEGTKIKDGKEITVKFIKEQDKLSRTEIQSDNESGIVLVSEKQAWTYFPLRNPSVEKIPFIDLTGLQTEMDIAGPLVGYETKGHRTELLGKEMVGENTCYKIKLTTVAGKELLFWIDAGTYLLTQSSVLPMGSTQPTSFTLYKDYKVVDGIQFAHSCETKFIGLNLTNSEGEIIFHNIVLNPAIDSNMYQPV